jgi:hypothetical protein
MRTHIFGGTFPDVEQGREGQGDDKVIDHDDDDDDDDNDGAVGDRTTTSAASPSKYARQAAANAKPVTKSQVGI